MREIGKFFFFPIKKMPMVQFTFILHNRAASHYIGPNESLAMIKSNRFCDTSHYISWFKSNGPNFEKKSNRIHSIL